MSNVIYSASDFKSRLKTHVFFFFKKLLVLIKELATNDNDDIVSIKVISRGGAVA